MRLTRSKLGCDSSEPPNAWGFKYNLGFKFAKGRLGPCSNRFKTKVGDLQQT